MLSKVPEAIKSIAPVLKEVRTHLQLAALSFFAFVAIMIVLGYFANDQGADQAVVYAAGMVATALAAVITIGFIVVKIARVYETRGASATLPGPERPDGFDFDIPSTLLVSNHGEQEPNGSYVFRSLRVSTIRSWTTGDFTVQIRSKSSGLIQSSRSVSDPLTATTTFAQGRAAGVTQVEFHAASMGELFMLVQEEERRLRLTNGDREIPLPDDVVLHTLHKKFLTSSRNEYVGTLINHPTGRVRFLVYFPEGLLPDEFLAYKINAQGQTSKNGLVHEVVPSKNLVVLEAEALELHSGVFLIWSWPDRPPARAVRGPPEVTKIPRVRGPRAGEVFSRA